jgi:hypothetical protein
MEQFDLKEFAQMFDAALASDNPAVKKALRNFMMVAAIVHAEEVGDERIMGPLETLVKKVGDLERMVYDIHTKQMTEKSYRDYYKDYIGTNPTWGYNPNTSTTSGTTWKDTLGYSAEDVYELMKDLKFK